MPVASRERQTDERVVFVIALFFLSFYYYLKLKYIQIEWVDERWSKFTVHVQPGK